MLSPLRLVTISPDGRPYRNIVKFLEILTILGATAILFSKLEEDMQTFGYYVCGGLVYVVVVRLLDARRRGAEKLLRRDPACPSPEALPRALWGVGLILLGGRRSGI